jgi:hypothetical protein
MEDIVTKIKKLLAKAAEGAGSSEAEAETCARKARELMDLHGVSEESLRERAEGPGLGFVSMKYMDPWRRLMLNMTAKYYGCELVFTNGGSKIVGRESSRVVAESMYEYLERTVLRLASAYRSSVKGTRGDQLNFERACGSRVATRLRELREANEAAARAEGATGTDLVLVTERTEAAAFRAEQFPDLTYTKNNGGKKVGAAAVAGRAAGDGIALGGQVGGGSSARRIA